MASNAATEQIDALSGVDQSFTAGYSARAYGARYHDEAVREIEGREPESPFLSPTAGTSAVWSARGGYASAVTYDTNSGNAARNANGDTTFLNSANWSLERRSGNSFISNGVNAGYTHPVEDNKAREVSHNYQTQAAWKFNRLKANFNNSLSPNKAFAVGERNELSVNNRQQVTTYADSANLNLGYEVSPKTDAACSFLYSLFYFPTVSNSESVNSFSTQTYTLNPSVSHRLTPKTSVHVDYKRELAEFFQGGGLGSTSDSVSVGVSRRLTSKMGASVGVGYRVLKYKNDRTPTAKSPTITAGLYRQLTSKLVASLIYTRAMGENFDAVQEQNLQEVTDFLGLNLTYPISSHLSLNGDAGVQVFSKEGFITMPDIDNPELTFRREEKSIFYQWGLLLDWHPRKHVSFLAGYKFMNKNSSFKDFEYDGQKFVIGMRSQF